MEYEGYLEALPIDELRRQHLAAETLATDYARTKEELELELSRRGIEDYIHIEVTE